MIWFRTIKRLWRDQTTRPGAASCVKILRALWQAKHLKDFEGVYMLFPGRFLVKSLRLLVPSLQFVSRMASQFSENWRARPKAHTRLPHDIEICSSGWKRIFHASISNQIPIFLTSYLSRPDLLRLFPPWQFLPSWPFQTEPRFTCSPLCSVFANINFFQFTFEIMRFIRSRGEHLLANSILSDPTTVIASSGLTAIYIYHNHRSEL